MKARPDPYPSCGFRQHSALVHKVRVQEVGFRDCRLQGGKLLGPGRIWFISAHYCCSSFQYNTVWPWLVALLRASRDAQLSDISGHHVTTALVHFIPSIL